MAERKGTGHPDSICDSIAEAVSVALCRRYLHDFGAIFHHNVDKALLVGGSANPAWSGGAVTQPIELYIAGRATRQMGSMQVPVDDIAEETARSWLREHLRFLDPEAHVRILPKIRPGSRELIALFQRYGKGEVPLANDTSIGVGYYPLGRLDEQVLAIERLLNHPDTKGRFPFVGEDIKVMGVASGEHVSFTVAIAMVDRFLAGLNDYRKGKDDVRRFIAEAIGISAHSLTINAADDLASGNVYLTVTGTSAENGDDGQVGRGNRNNGLITPYQPMSLEAISGKNPVSHVGKIYNLFADKLCRSIYTQGWAEGVQVFMVSEIGRPITRPLFLDVYLKHLSAERKLVHEFIEAALEEMPDTWREVIA